MTLTLVDDVEKTTVVLTANWSGREESSEGALCDFEGEPEEGDPVYEACKVYAPEWSAEISKRLGRPSHFEAQQNDHGSKSKRLAAV